MIDLNPKMIPIKHKQHADPKDAHAPALPNPQKFSMPGGQNLAADEAHIERTHATAMTMIPAIDTICNTVNVRSFLKYLKTRF